jgi:NAD(P)-dependent dehydrogenase (short-subunit alcohol dehydrogenase family)
MGGPEDTADGDVVTIVTGGSRGIGLAVGERLLAHGGRVCLTARKADHLTAVVADLERRYGAGRVLGVAGRADDTDHQAATVAATLQRFGRLDRLVNNAATNTQVGPLVDADPDAVAKTMRVNLLGPLGWTRTCWHAAMREAGGVVLNVSSIGGVRASKHAGAYNVSKAALLHLTRQLALELAPVVRVNALAVGLVPTHFSEVLVRHSGEQLAAAHPMRRLGTPQDIAAAAHYLLSAESGWVTGSTLTIDGGGTSLADAGSVAVAGLDAIRLN